MTTARTWTMGLLATAVSITIGGTAGIQAAESAARTSDSFTSARAAYDSLPLSFEQNDGQADARVIFLARGSGYGVSLTSTGALLSLSKPAAAADKAGEIPRFESDMVEMTLVGANVQARAAGRDPLVGHSNYFLGSDPSQWYTNVPTFAKVSYAAVYPGVDLVYYGNQHQLEYDFSVAPGADPRAIVMSFTGAHAMRIDDDGALVLTLAYGEIRQPAPVVYQNVRGARTLIRGRYAIKNRDAHLVAFEIGRYDRTLPLVIDPTVVYSTYLGGSGSQNATGIAVDQSGSAYVTGYTNSADFPLTAGTIASTVDPCCSIFVAKFNAAGTSLVYSTFIGGPGGGIDIAVDAAGNVYLAANGGPGLPVVNGFQGYQGYQDGYVAKLDPTGSTLLYSSYIGGGGNDAALGVAADSSGHAYVVGYENSGTLPSVTTNALLTYNPSAGCDGGGATGFLVRVNTTLSGAASLEYGTNIGGAGGGTNAATGVAVDNAGNAYVTGATSSTFFPTTAGAFQPAFNGPAQCYVDANAYVMKINTAPASCTPSVVNGTYVTCTESLVYGTYLGGSSDNFANGIAIDAAGNAYVTGATASTDFPVTANAPQSAQGGGYDVFIAKLNAPGAALSYSTFLGGTSDEFGQRVAADSSGNAYVTGYTNSTNFPTTTGALQTASGGGSDAFVTKVSTTGPGPFAYSSYLGGTGNDLGYDVALDGSGNVYVAGMTSSSNFVTTAGVFQPALSGTTDAFITKMSLASLQQLIQSLAATIGQALGLSGRQLAAVTNAIDSALTHLEKRNPKAAVTDLKIAATDVQLLIDFRFISPAQGRPIIAAINAVIAQISQ